MVAARVCTASPSPLPPSPLEALDPLRKEILTLQPALFRPDRFQAHSWIGKCCKPKGVSQDHAEAFKWFRLAAERGFAMAQNNLGGMYYNGQGLPQDYAEAVRWYRLAAEQGAAAAQNNLGMIYGNGQGVPRDLVVSYFWTSMAVSQMAAAARAKEITAGRMTTEQIAQAEGLVQDWPASKASYKPDLDAKARDGTTALVHAVAQGDATVATYLLSEGADPNIADNAGWTALLHGGDKGQTAVVATLLAHGADPNHRDIYGGTALLFASANGHVEIVETLLAKGADPTLKADSGATALTLAQRQGHSAIVELLQAVVPP